jgi:ElaB/YqjD/DUF883 family membrane-anchored ribosome-binding protein
MASIGGTPYSPSDDSLTADPSGMSTGAARDGQNELLERVVQGAHQTIDRLADAVSPHLQRMQSGVSTAGESLTARKEELRETTDEWADSLRDTVRENPLAAVAAAVAVGIIVARLSS